MQPPGYVKRQVAVLSWRTAYAGVEGCKSGGASTEPIACEAGAGQSSAHWAQLCHGRCVAAKLRQEDSRLLIARPGPRLILAV